MKIIALVLLALLSGPSAWAEAAKPNIIVIIAADLGWQDVGWHGGEIKMPHLDQLAHARPGSSSPTSPSMRPFRFPPT